MKLIIEASTDDVIEIVKALGVTEVIISGPEIDEPCKPKPVAVEAETDEFVSQFAAKSGTRRSKLEMAKCEKEEALGRFLTPEEEGEIEAEFEESISRKDAAKERAKHQARIKKVEQELTEDTESSIPFETAVTTHTAEAETQEPETTVPKTDPLTKLDSLFNN